MGPGACSRVLRLALVYVEASAGYWLRLPSRLPSARLAWFGFGFGFGFGLGLGLGLGLRLGLRLGVRLGLRLGLGQGLGARGLVFA